MEVDAAAHLRAALAGTTAAVDLGESKEMARLAVATGEEEQAVAVRAWEGKAVVDWVRVMVARAAASVEEAREEEEAKAAARAAV